MIFAMVKQILNNVYDTEISMMRFFREKLCDNCISFTHQIIDNEQITCFWINGIKTSSGKPCTNLICGTRVCISPNVS